MISFEVRAELALLVLGSDSIHVLLRQMACEVGGFGPQGNLLNHHLRPPRVDRSEE